MKHLLNANVASAKIINHNKTCWDTSETLTFMNKRPYFPFLCVRMLQTAVDYSEHEKVTSFAVGVKGYVLGELELIAGSKERVITVDDFDELYGIVATIQQGIQSLEG